MTGWRRDTAPPSHWQFHPIVVGLQLSIPGVRRTCSRGRGMDLQVDGYVRERKGAAGGGTELGRLVAHTHPGRQGLSSTTRGQQRHS